MKKIVCMALIAVALCIPFTYGMANAQQTAQQNSVPLSSQEMQSFVGGWCLCVNLWIFQVCIGNSGGCE
jgi:hypothetical protein